MNKALSAIGVAWKAYRNDVLALFGFACLLYGVARIYRPAAWIVGGGAVLAYVVFVAYRDLRNRKGP